MNVRLSHSNTSHGDTRKIHPPLPTKAMSVYHMYSTVKDISLKTSRQAVNVIDKGYHSSYKAAQYLNCKYENSIMFTVEKSSLHVERSRKKICSILVANEKCSRF